MGKYLFLIKLVRSEVFRAIEKEGLKSFLRTNLFECSDFRPSEKEGREHLIFAKLRCSQKD